MNSSNNFKVVGKFLGAMPKKKLENGKNVSSFYLDVTDNPDYPNNPEFSLYGDKCDFVDGFKKMDEVEVSFNISGKKYKNKTTGKEGVFTKLQAWKIEKYNPVGANAPMPLEVDEGAFPASNEVDDTLPF